mmetsp:Transcript_20892/g.67282  ORF Transcript_20892/g.67282 Transcript_20892/m.67282 type:complete len:238 (-) Transcript_20892:1246-1959(-)
MVAAGPLGRFSSCVIEEGASRVEHRPPPRGPQRWRRSEVGDDASDGEAVAEGEDDLVEPRVSSKFEVELVHGLLEVAVAALGLGVACGVLFGGVGVVAEGEGPSARVVAGVGLELGLVFFREGGAGVFDAEDAALPEGVVRDDEGALAEEAGVEEGVEGAGVALLVGVEVGDVEGVVLFEVVFVEEGGGVGFDEVDGRPGRLEDAGFVEVGLRYGVGRPISVDGHHSSLGAEGAREP